MTAEDLARIWIEAWDAGAPERVPLAEGFTHTSPFGHIEGRDAYLEWMRPMAGENASSLRVVRLVGDGDEAVVHYEMQTPAGAIHMCDWITVTDGEIAAIHAFYDATDLR